MIVLQNKHVVLWGEMNKTSYQCVLIDENNTKGLLESGEMQNVPSSNWKE